MIDAGPARWIREVAELRAENERLRHALKVEDELWKDFNGLRAELERLRAALREIADLSPTPITIAREALRQK